MTYISTRSMRTRWRIKYEQGASRVALARAFQPQSRPLHWVRAVRVLELVIVEPISHEAQLQLRVHACAENIWQIGAQDIATSELHVGLVVRRRHIGCLARHRFVRQRLGGSDGAPIERFTRAMNSEAGARPGCMWRGPSTHGATPGLPTVTSTWYRRGGKYVRDCPSTHCR